MSAPGPRSDGSSASSVSAVPRLFDSSRAPDDTHSDAPTRQHTLDRYGFDSTRISIRLYSDAGPSRRQPVLGENVYAARPLREQHHGDSPPAPPVAHRPHTTLSSSYPDRRRRRISPSTSRNSVPILTSGSSEHMSGSGQQSDGDTSPWSSSTISHDEETSPLENLSSPWASSSEDGALQNDETDLDAADLDVAEIFFPRALRNGAYPPLGGQRDGSEAHGFGLHLGQMITSVLTGPPLSFDPSEPSSSRSPSPPGGVITPTQHSDFECPPLPRQSSISHTCDHDRDEEVVSSEDYSRSDAARSNGSGVAQPTQSMLDCSEEREVELVTAPAGPKPLPVSSPVSCFLGISPLVDGTSAAYARTAEPESSPRKRVKLSPAAAAERVITSAPPIQRIPALLETAACSICLEAPRHAVATPCGHMLCGQCLFVSLKSSAVRMQREREVSDRRDVAESMHLMATAPPSNLHVGLQGPDIFLPPRILAKLLRRALENTTVNLLNEFINRNRHRTTAAWVAFTESFVFADELRAATSDIGALLGVPSHDSHLHTSRSHISEYLNNEKSNELSNVLVSLDPSQGQVYSRITAAVLAHLVNIWRMKCSAGAAPVPQVAVGYYTVFWPRSIDPDTCGDLIGHMRQVEQLVASLEKMVDMRSPAEFENDPETLPTISPAVSTKAVRSVAALEREHSLNWALGHGGQVDTQDALDNLSAMLWAVCDVTRTAAEYRSIGWQQRARDIDTLVPPTAMGVRRTQAHAYELDPMRGICPVCRAPIPGGLFGGAVHTGAQGLRFKVARPADELALRYGPAFLNQHRAGRVDPALSASLLNRAPHSPHSRPRTPTAASTTHGPPPKPSGPIRPGSAADPIILS